MARDLGYGYLDLELRSTGSRRNRGFLPSQIRPYAEAASAFRREDAVVKLRLLAMPVLAGLAASAVYRFALRERSLSWGATTDELGPLPGDELLAEPDMTSTRAISIAAPASDVWPWLVQMGSGRGGAYTYDWIENLLGLEMHSTDRVLPEFQDLQVGDVLFSPKEGPGMRAEIIDPERTLAWRSEDGKWVWTFNLIPADEGTRLVSRNRFVLGPALRSRLVMAVVEPGSWVMERKMLLGIKERAERLARESAPA